MVLPNEPLPWQCSTDSTMVPLEFEEEVIGFCQPEHALQIVEILNDEQKHRRALYLACSELVRRSRGRLGTIEGLMAEYLEQAAMPRTGTRAIAILLHDRREELGVDETEFVKFCDSYRLTPAKLQAIYENNLTIDSTLYAPLARILGQPIEDIVAIVEG